MLMRLGGWATLLYVLPRYVPDKPVNLLLGQSLRETGRVTESDLLKVGRLPVSKTYLIRIHGNLSLFDVLFISQACIHECADWIFSSSSKARRHEHFACIQLLE